MLVCAAHAGAADEAEAVKLVLPPTPKVAFSGVMNLDVDGKSGEMKYPAPNLVGFLAVVAVHAATASAAVTKEQEQRQIAANKVLEPYQSVLDGFTPEELRISTLAQLAKIGAKTEIDSSPAFAMTQDQRALVLDNMLEIRAPGISQPYRQSVRVVLPAAPVDQAPAYWMDSNGKALKEASAHLLALSIEVAMADMQAGTRPEGKHKTVRYMEGAKEKTERAELLQETCDSLVLRTLRGNLMYVPRKDVATCG